MAKFSDFYKDNKNLGFNLDTPQFDVAYNLQGRQLKSGSGSNATIDFKIFYEPQNFENVTNDDIEAVKNLAYQVLSDSEKLSIPVRGDSYSTTLMLKNISVKPVPGTNVWEVTAKYNDSFEQSDVQVVLKNFQFSTQGRTSHIVRSLGTVWPPPGAGYNFGNMIGYNDGEFTGCDVKRPNLTFQRDIWILLDDLNMGIVQAFAGITGSVNADVFYGFAPGEVLFTGITQGQRASLKIGDATFVYWQISLAFETSPSTVIWFKGRPVPKAGWDYAWYLTQKTTYSSDAGRIVTREPIQLNVEMVYPRVAFCEFFGFGWGLNMNDGAALFDV